MSIIWFFFSFLSIFFKRFFYVSIALLGIILVWVRFTLFYFLFASEGPFDGGYVFDDLGEDTFEDSNDWDKHWFYFGFCGIRKATIQLFGQLDKIKLHWTWHVKKQKKWRKSMPSLTQSSLHRSYVSPPQSMPVFIPTSRHLFCHSYNHPLWDLMGLEMINFLKFSMKLLRKIKGKKLLSKVSNLFRRCKGHKGKSFAYDFRLERGPCWE